MTAMQNSAIFLNSTAFNWEIDSTGPKGRCISVNPKAAVIISLNNLRSYLADFSLSLVLKVFSMHLLKTPPSNKCIFSGHMSSKRSKINAKGLGPLAPFLQIDRVKWFPQICVCNIYILTARFRVLYRYLSQRQPQTFSNLPLSSEQLSWRCVCLVF